MALSGGNGRLGHAVAVFVLVCSLPADASPDPAHPGDPTTGGGHPTSVSADAALVSAPAGRDPSVATLEDAVVVARSVPALRVGSAASHRTTDIPPRALVAYERASHVLLEARPSCRIPWSFLAALGSVESDHGRAAGSRLTWEGMARPAIVTEPLDGREGTAAAADTDDGSLDGSAAWDSPVGPFRMLPSLWRAVGVDGDGDGLRRAQDIDDAAVATAVRLCTVSRNLELPGEMRRALEGLGAQSQYIAAVLELQAQYRTSVAEPVWLGAIQVSATPITRTAATIELDRPRPSERSTGPSTDPAPDRRLDAAPQAKSSGDVPTVQDRPGSQPSTEPPDTGLAGEHPGPVASLASAPPAAEAAESPSPPAPPSSAAAPAPAQPQTGPESEPPEPAEPTEPTEPEPIDTCMSVPIPAPTVGESDAVEPTEVAREAPADGSDPTAPTDPATESDCPPAPCVVPEQTTGPETVPAERVDPAAVSDCVPVVATPPEDDLAGPEPAEVGSSGP